MRDLSRLPPLLRVASIMSILALFLLTVTLVSLLLTRLPSPPPPQVDSSRLEIIAANLGAIGLFYWFVVRSYSLRVREFGIRPLPLESWQSQARILVLMAALPLCALMLALVISPTQRAFEVVFPISIVGALIGFVVCMWASYG